MFVYFTTHQAMHSVLEQLSHLNSEELKQMCNSGQVIVVKCCYPNR